MFNYYNSERSRDKEEFHIKSLIDVLSKYRWLTDSFNVDYFIENHWNKLPQSWAQILDQFELKDIESLLSGNRSYSYKQSVLPLSLLSLRATSLTLQLSRKLSDEQNIVLSKRNLEISKSNELFHSDNSKEEKSKTLKMKNEILNRRVKHKKRHEIVRLSQMARQVLDLLPDCNTIVDCGSGQGHLSRILSLCYGYNVISIEADSHNICGAVKLDDKALATLLRYKLTETSHSIRPQKVNYMLNKTSSVNEVTRNSKNHVLIGLHACGSLSQIILKQFATSDEAKALILVSCCYMKREGDSFPLSKFVRSNLTHPMSYEAKEVACHAIEKFVQKLQPGGNVHSLNVHCFRALLESLLDKYHPNMRHKAMKSVKIFADMSFSDYFDKAVRGLNISIPRSELKSEYVNKCLAQFKRVLIFYSLRLLIAPLVESLILLDFISYLREKGISTVVFPLFDPIVSPRNNVLIAIKEEMNKMNL